jgi:NADH:ubiquinone oxidoreductase subunit F (NADH-binding)
VSTTVAAGTLPRLLAGVAELGSLDLPAHLEMHGPAPELAPARRGAPGELIDEVERAGLKGRGGAGFPTALKMHAVAGARVRSSGRTVVINAVEGEPASLKDRTLIGSAPHLVLDGAVLAARAVSAGEIVLCVSERAADTVDAAVRALAERRALRERVSTRVVAVPDGYVGGQESALVHHLNGGRAVPTFTPPMIFERGVGGRPTLLSNAETFAHVALIARHGAEWFRALGTPEHRGSALVTLGGPVPGAGVYEIEHGASLQSLIGAAGGLEERLRGVLVGGYAGTWIDAAHIPAITIDDVGLGSYGASTGAGVIVLLGERACPVAETVRVTSWLAAQSAAQCGPCEHGLAAVAIRLAAWAAGSRGGVGAAEQRRLAAVIRGRGACRHPDGTLRFVSSAIDVFASEFADHGAEGPCDACGAPAALPLPRAASVGRAEERAAGRSLR